MTSISPLAFIIIGTIVTITSLLVDGIRAFAFVGAGLILWGMGRFVLDKNEKKIDTQLRFVHCPYCKNIVRPTDNFCSNCGQSLRKYGRSNPNLNKGSYYQYPNRQHQQVRHVR